jgi:hypothetical protein
MSYYTHTSAKYKGIEVVFSYYYEPDSVSYTSYGDFNGGTPGSLDIDIVDVLLKEESIYELLAMAVIDDLKEEISQVIQLAA